MTPRLASLLSPALAALALGAAACGSTEAPLDACAIADVAGLSPELFFATVVPDDREERALGPSVFGALDGAAPGGLALTVRDALGKELAAAAVDDAGRVMVGVDAKVGDVLELAPTGADAERVRFCVRDPEAARRAAVHAPIDGAGSVPNDLVIVGPPDRARGVLVRSGDNAVSVFDLATGLDGAPLGVRLPDTEDRCGHHPANPWFAAPLDDAGARVAVTAYGQGRVYLVDLDRGAIERVLEAPRPVALDAPFTLARAVDLDCDGAPETSIDRVAPRTPQGLAREGTTLAVGYAGFVAPRTGSAGPVYVPGVLALWDLAALDAAPRTIVLPALDPQEVRPLGDGRVLVTCSGVIDPVGARVTATTPGMVLEVDVARGAITRSYALDGFAPGTALVHSGSLWVGSLVRGAVRRIDLESGALLDELVLTSDEVDSVLRLIELPGGLVGAPSFDNDLLFVLDAKSGELSPPPFFGPLQLGPGRPLFDGVQVIARRPGRPGIDFSGPDLFALSGVSSRVVPVELRRLLGP